MIIAADKPVHLTYCMNVHPGEHFEDQWNAIKEHVEVVRNLLNANDRPFGLGLRLGGAAVKEIQTGKHLSSFKKWCDHRGYYVFTINGFPFGDFHSGPVKDQVYRPDWTTVERCEYTKALADILSVLLPPDTQGSISTVPGWFASDYSSKVSRTRALASTINNLADTAKHLEKIAIETGRDLCLALEPEPGCFLETVDDVESFFRDELIPRAARILSVDFADANSAEEVVRRRIGICVDVCHCAIAYEDPVLVMRRLEESRIRIAKIQLSAALSADLRKMQNRREVLREIAKFSEPVYFHQTSARFGAKIERWPDLPAALDRLEAGAEADDMRVHFHVPLHWPGKKFIESTRRIMTDEFWTMIHEGICPNLEIETYTFHVLPQRIAGKNLAESIEKEYRWVMEKKESR